MPDIFLDLRRIDYVSEQNAPVSAWRAYAETLFTTSTSARASFSCIVDTGAPFSVLPFSLWQTYNVQWSPLGKQLTCQGKPAQGVLKWQDVECSLGATYVELIDLRTGMKVSRPFLVVAKFASQRSQHPRLELAAVLGMNFLTDNNLRLELEGTGVGLVGYFSIR
jgi:hypothetical protein